MSIADVNRMAELTQDPDGPAIQPLVAAIEGRFRAGVRPGDLLAELAVGLFNRPARHWILHARALLALGRPREAADLLAAGGARIRSAEIDVEFWRAKAMTAFDAAGAETLFREVLARNPRHEGAGVSLAGLLRDQGRLNAASETVLALRRAQGGGLLATLKCCSFLLECRQHALAAQLFSEELDAGARDPLFDYHAGATYMVQGDFARARECFDRFLATVPDTEPVAGLAIWLASAQKYASAEHPDFGLFRSLAENADAADATRVFGAFALAKACDDVGDFETAATLLRQANALHHAANPWDAAAWEAFVESEPRRQRPSLPLTDDGGGRPLLVVGLPRTGTTLVEARLARHPQVRPRGELDWIGMIHREIESRGGQADAAALSRYAQMYRTHLRSDDAPARWYIDKNPLNFQYLDLVAAMLPEARIIHCVRDRRDTALSIWSQHFSREENNYAYDLRDIARFAEGHDRLMQGWQAAPRLPTLTVQYEELVADPEQGLARMEAFLDLDAHAACAAMTGAKQEIQSASLWQARQPVYRTSVERWRRYREFIPEIEALFDQAARSHKK